MHILFLTDNFPPEVNAPASRTFEHCQEWVRAGHKVTVITGSPNFPKGRVYSGYRNNVWSTEEVQGIKVIRVWTYITVNQGFVRRTLDYQSFMVSATIAGLFVYQVDVVVGTSPQFFTACAAYVVGLLKRVPFVFELRDLWPESIKVVGAMKESRLLNLLERLELFLYRKAAYIVSVTHSFRRHLGERGIDQTKIGVVTNGVDLSRFKAREKDAELSAQLGLSGKFVVGYIGTHGMAHGLEVILEAADKARGMPNGDDYVFLFLGDGARKRALQQQALEMGLTNVLFLDSVQKHDVARYWSLLDVSVIHLKSAELFSTVIPSKLFESMGMGIPILHGVSGESADLVRREDVGLVFESDKSDQLLTSLRRLYDDSELLLRLRNRCIEAASNYDRARLANVMLEMLEDVVEGEKDALNYEGYNNKEV